MSEVLLFPFKYLSTHFFFQIEKLIHYISRVTLWQKIVLQRGFHLSYLENIFKGKMPKA